MMRWCWLLLFVGCRSFDPAALDRLVMDAQRRLEVPGAAVAVVLHGEVVYQRILGVRELGKPEPITADTLFLIASTTKPMTTMMEAALVDEGKIAWNEPLTEVLPTFALADPELTKKLLVWHTSCACTGMPRRDLENIFEFAAISPEQRIASMKEMKPTTGLGETYQYSNLMFAAGGYAAAHAYAPALSFDQAYERAMKQKVFDPIGMRSSTTDFDAAMRAEHATPHALSLDGSTQVVAIDAERNVVNIAPAGAVWSNVADMVRYAMTELANGVAPDGKIAVSAANVLERRKQRIRSEEGGYGLGIGVGTTADGEAYLSHDGGAFGFGTTLFMLPERELGLVILTNVRNGDEEEELPFNAAVKKAVIYDLATGERALETYAKKRARREVAAPDPAWLAKLAGTYDEPSLGSIVLTPEGVLDAGEWSCRFTQHGEKLVLFGPPFAGGELTIVEVDGKPTLVAEYGALRYTFVRR